MLISQMSIILTNTKFHFVKSMYNFHVNVFLDILEIEPEGGPSQP